MRKGHPYKSLFILLSAIFYCACQPLIRVNKDPFEESFFEKTRLIMTEEEINAYRSLDAEDLKREFIEEFWRIRDPYPETEENENKTEFERRVLFANEWFDKYRRRRTDFEAKSARGWETTKGRIYIVFGHPDKVNYGGIWGSLKKFPPQDAIYESWYYSYYDLVIGFEREKVESIMDSFDLRGSDENEPDVPNYYVSNVVGSGGWRLSLDTKIIHTIEEAKRNWISPDFRSDIQNSLLFNAKYSEGHLVLSIPADRVTYVCENEELKVYLSVEIKIFRDGKNEFEIKENKILVFSEDEVLGLNDVIVKIPYVPADKGEYTYNLTVTDLKAEYLSKFRQIFKHVH